VRRIPGAAQKGHGKANRKWEMPSDRGYSTRRAEPAAGLLIDRKCRRRLAAARGASERPGRARAVNERRNGLCWRSK